MVPHVEIEEIRRAGGDTVRAYLTIDGVVRYSYDGKDAVTYMLYFLDGWQGGREFTFTMKPCVMVDESGVVIGTS